MNIKNFLKNIEEKYIHTKGKKTYGEKSKVLPSKAVSHVLFESPDFV